MTSLSGKARRRKGQAGEIDFFRELSEWLGEDCRRSLSASRDGGADNEAGGMLALWSIEVKRQDTPRIATWWQQALDQCHPAKMPALAYRLPRKPWRVIVPLKAINHEYPLYTDSGWMRLDFTAQISVEAFACVVREWQ